MNKTFTPSARRHHLLYWLSCLVFSAIPTISEAFVFENLEYTSFVATLPAFTFLFLLKQFRKVRLRVVES